MGVRDALKVLTADVVAAPPGRVGNISIPYGAASSAGHARFLWAVQQAALRSFVAAPFWVRRFRLKGHTAHATLKREPRGRICILPLVPELTMAYHVKYEVGFSADERRELFDFLPMLTELAEFAGIPWFPKRVQQHEPIAGPAAGQAKVVLHQLGYVQVLELIYVFAQPGNQTEENTSRTGIGNCVVARTKVRAFWRKILTAP